MITILTQADIDQLTAMRAVAQARPMGQKKYWEIYQVLADKLVNNYGRTNTDPTVLWLEGATQANRGVAVTMC